MVSPAGAILEHMEITITSTPYDGEILLCARLGDLVVGTADYDEADGCFDRVWTHPQARGRGVASALYAEVEAMGLPVAPSRTLTADGMAFWRSKGVDPGRSGSRLVPKGLFTEDDRFGTIDVSRAVEEWDAARAAPRP